MARTAIRDFSLANKIYVNATVTFYTVSNGARTTTKATLYAGLTGTSTLANPQTLDSYGKLRQPVYIDQAVICMVTGLGNTPDHETGIITEGDSVNAAAASAATAAAQAAATISIPSNSLILPTIGSTALLLSDIAQTPRINIKALGAKGDGSTDDTDAFLAALAMNPCDIHVPRGRYKITSTLTMKFGLHTISAEGGATLDFSSMTSGYAIKILPTASGVDSLAWRNSLSPVLKNIFILGPNSEATTTDGIYIGDPMSPSQIGNVSQAHLSGVWVWGFRDDIYIDHQTWCIHFIKCAIGKAWRYGMNIQANTNAGENYGFYGCTIYDCVNEAHTSIGIYVDYTANADVFFHGCSFDYCDFLLSVNSGSATLHGCHLENNNNNPQIVVTSTGGYEPGKLYMHGTNMGGGPFGSWPEDTDGRPTFISAAGDRTQIFIDSCGWGRWNRPASELVTVASGSPFISIRNIDPVLAANASPSIASVLNMIYNGGFETGNTDGWTIPVSNHTWAVDNTVSRTGSNSIKMVSADGTHGSGCSQRFNILPGQKVLCRGWLKTSGALTGTTGQVLIHLKWYTQTGVKIGGNVDSTGISDAADWTQVSLYKQAPAGTSYATLELYNYNASGTAWFDDISLWIF